MTGQFERRPLKFESLEEVARDAESLMKTGYRRGANWDLRQVSLHLSDWLRFPLVGYPRSPLLLRPVMWTLRVTVGKSSLRKILETGRMQPGGPTIPQTVHEATGNDAPAVEILKESLEVWKKHTGPIKPSPLFGVWEYETATKVQLIHCAHHLGFLIPRG